MIKAYQISPESRVSPLDFWGVEDSYPGIVFTGNRYCREHNLEMWKDAENTIEDLSYYFNDNPEAYESREAAVADIAKAGTVAEWEKIIENYCYPHYDDAIMEAMGIITGKAYEKRTIRGSSQGEWQDIYYPADEYSREAIKRLEAEYFNEGEEWDCQFESGESISVYTVGWRPDEHRREIAEAMGVKADEVELYVISGEHTVYDYEKLA